MTAGLLPPQSPLSQTTIRRSVISDDVDTLTVLKAESGSASKRIIRKDDGSIEIEGYSAGALFTATELQVKGIHELSVALTTIEKFPACLVIRGRSVTPLEPSTPVMRRKTQFLTPEGGHHWVMIDFDKTALPEHVRLSIDTEAVCEYLVLQLPVEFHSVSYHWQLSSKAGFTDPALVSMHLWFWLECPISDVDLKRWAKDWNDCAGSKLIDAALFNDVQPHYTAAPQFVNVDNPYPTRSGLKIKSRDAVALVLPPSQPCGASHTSLSKSKANALVSATTTKGFESLLASIGDHKGGDGFHNAIIRAVASYVATCDEDKLDIEKLYGLVSKRVLAANRQAHDDAYAELMASREHIMPAIESAIKKFGQQHTRRKPKLVEGIAPHYVQHHVSTETASADVERLIHSFFR